jgi:hypothetical protein
VISSTPAPFAYLSAIVETLIALALIFGLARQVTYFAAAAYNLFLWAIPEGFGGPVVAGPADRTPVPPVAGTVGAVPASQGRRGGRLRLTTCRRREQIGTARVSGGLLSGDSRER